MEVDRIFDEYYEKSLIRGGNLCCPGCGGSLFWRMALEALGPKTIVYGDGPCAMCAIRFLRVPTYAFHFSFVADGATGIVAALEMKGRDDITVVSSGGDGAVGDISFNKVSAAAERNENFIQICVDNEAYMNTGIQKSGLTPFGAWTTTTPLGKESPKKNLPFIIAQHGVPYVATVSISHPTDLKRKLRRAKEIKGFKYIHVLSPCPTGWRFHPSKTVEVARLSVETWIWPLYEIVDGTLRLTAKPKPKPVEEYLKLQGRFRTLSSEQVELIQRDVDAKRERLLENDGKKIILS